MTAHDHHDDIPTGAVVVGYDKTAAAGHALDWAADHAAKEGRPLVVVHAAGSLGTTGTTWLDQADPETEPVLVEMDRHGQALLAAATARVGERQPSVRVIPVVALEDVTSELGRLSHTAHLLVTGSRGHGLSRSVPTGQVGTWLARRTACPLVVVPDFDPDTARQGVLAGVRSGGDAAPVLDFAYQYASTHDLPLTIAHAAGRVDGDEKDELRRELAEVVSGYGERYPDVWAHTLLLPGRPAGKLLELAALMNLLVLGQHQGTGLHESPFGHVRSSVVDRSPCPTAIVPLPVAAHA